MAHSKILKKVLRSVRQTTAPLYQNNYNIVRVPRLKVIPGTAGFYADAKRFYESAGFQRLGDFRIASMPRKSAAYKTPLRIYLSPDRETVTDAFYLQKPLRRHIELGLSGLPMPLTYDFNTEFTDGGFLETSNAQSAAAVELPKSVVRVILSAYTPPRKILAAHRRELAKQKKLGRTVRPVANAKEMIASAVRLHELKAEFRRRIGHGSMKEIKAIKQVKDETAAKWKQLIDAFVELGQQAAKKMQGKAPAS